MLCLSRPSPTKTVSPQSGKLLRSATPVKLPSPSPTGINAKTIATPPTANLSGPNVVCTLKALFRAWSKTASDTIISPFHPIPTLATPGTLITTSSLPMLSEETQSSLEIISTAGSTKPPTLLANNFPNNSIAKSLLIAPARTHILTAAKANSHSTMSLFPHKTMPAEAAIISISPPTCAFP